ncbi:MAG: hypothetical protein HRU09_01910 [Oligoflexales bacterium]|nr:hypothetical protein [Oligoflexales bacterium]
MTFPRTLFGVVRLGDKLPVLQNIGVVPLSLSSSFSDDGDLSRKTEHLRTAFSESIRNSFRFHILHDELIEELWQSYAGRKELIEEYALSAFAHLNITLNDDVLVFTVRFLSPELKPMLQESEKWLRKDFILANYEEISQWVSSLVYRLINRIPIDVSITSVQGKYLTLSGGFNQGLQVGDDLDLIRVKIKALHPALHTWRSFSTRRLGKARIVESKENVSIAKLVHLVRENSVEIGDGAKSQDLLTRLRFARKEQKPSPRRSGEKIVMPPIYSEAEGDKASPAKDQLEIPLPPGFSSPAEWLASDQHVKKDPQGQVVDGKDKDLDYYLTTFADDLSVYVGQWGWSYSGPGSTGSKLTWYHIMNTVGARITRRIMPYIKYGFGGGLGLGKTQKNRGAYVGYDGHARLYWEDEHYLLDGLVQKLMAGGHAAFTGIGVSHEGFGGFDAIFGGIFLGLKGQFAMEESGSPYDWFLEFNLTPLSLGRVGYGNETHLIRSSLGWKLIWGAYQKHGARQLEWGAGWSYGKHSFFDDSSKLTSMSQYSLYLLGRWRF